MGCVLRDPREILEQPETPCRCGIRKVIAARPGDNRLQPTFTETGISSMSDIPPGSAIGVDLGGTKIHAAVVSPEGVVFSEHRLPTDVGGGPTKVVDDIVRAVRDELDADLSVINAVGVGLAGQVNAETGVVRSSPNLKWTDFPFAERLQQELGVPVAVENDVTTAAWGEWRHGAGQGIDDLLVLYVGTGVGGGIVSDGRLLAGARGMAGEVGHMTIAAGGRQCSCPNRGCLEAYVGGWAIAERAVEAVVASRDAGRGLLEMARGEELTARRVAEAAAAGDELALEVIYETGQYLGAGLTGLIHIFNPARVILGGGVIDGSPGLVAAAEAVVQASDGLEVRLSELGGNAGVIGSASMALERAGAGL
jgi:glucokinase